MTFGETMRISSAFDAGNIRCLDASNPADIRLAIAPDHNSEFYQWFYFRLSGARGEDCVLNIENAAGAAYPGGWEGYRAVASHDRRHWFRVPTDYTDGVLSIRHRPEADAVWYAYFAPYSMERHADLIARAQSSPRARLEVLGQSLDGQDVDLLVIGDSDPAKRSCWAIARQHPGESMAEWWMEGWIDRLLDPADAVARALLAKATFYVVPNMNPDGSRRGHLRTNAAGVNLNREWHAPTPDRSPEVYLVRRRMGVSGVDFCLDVHGDEALPYNFIAGSDGVPSFGPRLEKLLGTYRTALVRACPDFQTKHGYPPNPPGKANMTMCTSHVAEHFGCLAMTLEQPFKDNADAPDAVAGWSPPRAIRLGAACLDALHAVIDDLR